MKKFLNTILFIFLLAGFPTAWAQSSENRLAQTPWKAQWIAEHPGTDQSYGVYLFRKQFELSSKPESFIVNVSADNRYKLFVNEKLVSLGPARGDLYYWNYETVDLAPFLRQGINAVAALVWNEAEHRPEAQLTFQTGFILNGSSAEEEIINTNNSWKCARQESYQPLPVKLNAYYVAGAGELIDMNKHISGWEKSDFDDRDWKNAVKIGTGLPKGVFEFDYRWMLVPSPIPQMELTMQRIPKARKAVNASLSANFPSSKAYVDIMPRTKATILLDQTFLTNAYFNLGWSKGKDATITITYAESLSKDGVKGNRDEVEGKEITGRTDRIISNGTRDQSFCTLWWRTFRYIQLTIETAAEPLTIEDVYGTFTGYPFKFKATLKSDNPNLAKNLEIGWRTARLCAVETYMDCPYYEQLQYIGDTRIQALVSYFNSGDDLLARNALDMMDHSTIAEGLPLSRHPSYTPQVIPTFSLWYIHMLHDFWRYRPDASFVKQKLSGTRQVLDFFHRYQQRDGSLKGVPYWLFTDWVDADGWKDGFAPTGKDGNSAVLDIQLLWTYQVAAELETNLGWKEYAGIYTSRAKQLENTIKTKYWSQEKGMFADTPEKNLFSQHTNSLAVLCGLISGVDAENLMRKILTTEITEASIYFKYYFHQALIKAGLGEFYLNWLGKWSENIRMGLTTWAEMSDVANSRSDCHAWGSSPNIEFFRTVLGIDSDGPGFRKVKIEPHLGDLKKISGSIPHPNGNLSVDYEFRGAEWSIKIDLPESVTGSFIWNGKTYPLKVGQNSFAIK